MGGPRNRSGGVDGPGLFPPGALDLRPTGQARLRSLARRPHVPATPRQRIEAENRRMMAKLRGWGVELGRTFDLRFTSLEPEQEHITEWYGICYEDGVIRIRLRNARNGRLLKESSLVDTLCHELAHLRHLDHGRRWERLYERILEHARARGIYCPGPVADSRPRQGTLFADGCGTRARRRGKHGSSV